MKVPVWGWSNPGSAITVTFAGKSNVNTLASDVAKNQLPIREYPVDTAH
jgi:hypothetical protein